MKKPIILSLALFSLLSFKTHHNHRVNNDAFSKELYTLKDLFHIPGMAVLVKDGSQTVYEDYIGLADVKRNIPVDSATVFPMASLTKIFSAILIMKLAEEQKLQLENPIDKYLSQQKIGDSVQIKHVLSHTSQGNVGKHFYYSSRYSWLTKVIETASSNTFEGEMNDRIIKPLGLKRTLLLKDSAQVTNAKVKLAQPYFYEGELKDGFIDYGFSAAAGIASTVRDLARLSTALDNNTLINKDSKGLMLSPFKSDLPYGYGIFTQNFLNMKVVWAYGQYDCYSSLFLKIPEKNLTLIIAANNSLMSDPARLIYGNAGYSLFAISFLKNYVLNQAKEPLLEDAASLKSLSHRITASNSEFYRKKLLAQSIAEGFLAMYENGKSELSEKILEQVFSRYPDYESYTDLTLLHNLSFLKTVVLFKDKKNFTKFDTIIEQTGTRLLNTDGNNPYANSYMAEYYSNKGADTLALKHYNKILTAGNFSRNWYTTEAENWVKSHKK